jgi:membrane-associated protease RseP (regulator of RpoE activity)
MTLHESTAPDALPPALLEDDASHYARVRSAVQTVMAIAEENVIDEGAHYSIAFKGEFLIASDEAFAQLDPVLAPLGFSAFFQRYAETDAILVIKGLMDADSLPSGGSPLRRLMRISRRSPAWLHGTLLIITLASTVYAGAFLLDGGELSIGSALRAGGPFALTLLFILGIHEMGHYFAARYHRVKVTLPFFIPLPVAGSLGTLGAVIFIRSPLKTRRALFDVGLSGPLVGLAAALPLFVVGLLLPPIEFGAPINLIFRGVGVPPLLQALGNPLVEGSLSRAILVHPVALAAWFGVLLTALNLLPVGQFDGGHVAYALFGRRAWPLAMMTISALMLAGFYFWPTWLIWGVLALLSGLRHTPPQDDVTPLDIRRRLLGWLTILIFVLIIMPQPIISRQTVFAPGQNTVPVPTMAAPNLPTPTPFSFGG